MLHFQNIKCLSIYYFICYLTADNVPCVFGSPEEYDFPLWPRNVPTLWRPNE